MTDPFRVNYRPLNTQEAARVALLKEHAGQLYDDLVSFMPGPAGSDVQRACNERAKTKLEEAVMWAVKGITG